MIRTCRVRGGFGNRRVPRLETGSAQRLLAKCNNTGRKRNIADSNTVALPVRQPSRNMVPLPGSTYFRLIAIQL
jgi:hypothetical protein